MRLYTSARLTLLEDRGGALSRPPASPSL